MEMNRDNKPDGAMNNLILETIVSKVVYLVVLVSIFLFFAGHNFPGGGFVGGLMSAAALVLMYVTFGSKFLEKVRFNYKITIALGVLLSTLSGMSGMLFKYPFLTQFDEWATFPFFGDVHLASAVVFDLGIYLCVVGGAMIIITGIGEKK